MQEIKVRVVWGTAMCEIMDEYSDAEIGICTLESYDDGVDGSIREYSFNTQGEADAFLKGIEEGAGWNDWRSVTI